MKRISSLLLALALMCALALPAAADVAYLPRDNFIEKHWDECSYMNRWFYTNGAEGYVLAHKTPDSAEATPLPNGRKYYISNVYKGEWGVLEYDRDTLENNLTNGSVSGWVRMSEMVADYDNDSFMADHAAEIRSEEVTLEWEAHEPVCAYKYPGSGEVRETLERGWFGQEPEILFNLCFTDPAGREWGYCGYFYGHRDMWVCLDDPYNGALPPDENCVTVATRPAAGEETPEPTPAETPAPVSEATPAPAPAGKTVELTPPADDETMKQAAKDNRGAGPYLAAGGAGVVVVAAAVLVAALKKKKQ
jgi:hypothetical protein